MGCGAAEEQFGRCLQRFMGDLRELPCVVLKGGLITEICCKTTRHASVELAHASLHATIGSSKE